MRTPLLTTMLLLVVSLFHNCSGSANAMKIRDTAGALNGALVAAQKQHQQDCAANPSLKPCVVINKAIDAQDALLTALEAYCSWSLTTPPADMNAANCQPVDSAKAGLQTALANAELFIVELKGVVK